MKKIFTYFLFVLALTNTYAQNYIFTNTGNGHSYPYGVKSWDWDTAAYKHFSYASVEGSDSYTMPYRLLSPPNNNPTTKYPLFIMLHGAGEGVGSACDMSNNKNTCQLMWGGRIALDSINKYPGYVFFPQTGGGYWGNNGAGNAHYGFNDPMASPTRAFFDIIEKVLLQNYNIDPDRIYIAGLSAGGRAVWEFLLRRPDLFAAATPFSGMGNPYLAKTIINNPVWNYQGGMDRNPGPFETKNMYDSIVKYGGSPKRSLYVDRDHWSWVDAYESKTWMQWIYAQNKKNIHILYGAEPNICQDSSISLGFSYGFLQYQWKRNGVNIPGANAYVQNVNQPGTYTVDFQRKTGVWATSNTIVIGSKSCNTSSENGLRYAYYEGNYTSIPNLSQVTPKKTGTISNFLLTPRDRDLNYILKYDGFLDITTAGNYTFYTTSDDGSNLFINGKQIVFNDFLQGPTERSGSINLSAGKNAISVSYLQGTGGQTLEVRYEGPGVLKQQIPTFKLFINPPSGWNNLPPVAYAGKDSTLLLPNNSIVLNGNGVDGDGTISSYLWSKISGPSATLSGVNNASVTLSNLTSGAYLMKLTVTDNQGAIGADTIKVLVESVNNGINYAYYEGNYSNVPNFSALVAKKTGTLKNFSLSPRDREDQFALKFDGFIDITTAGLYTFFTTSDDGSKLYIDGVQIVNNDFLQGPTERSGSANLTVGKKAISVAYFEQGGGQTFEVRYQGPGIGKQLMPNYVLFKSSGTGNQNPTAIAGSDVTITLPTNSTTFTGSGTDTDGTISTYAWTKISGPASEVLSGASTPTLAVTSLTEGSYVYRLTVTDNNGATSADDVALTVNPAVTSGTNGLKYSYYEGYYTNLPAFNTLTPKKTGNVSNYSLVPRDIDMQYAFKYEGYIDIATAGMYTFFTTSDDGSKLFIDGIEIVNNDFLQGPTERSGNINLSTGKKAITVTFFQLGGGANLEVRYQGPSIAKQLIPGAKLFINQTTGGNNSPTANAGSDRNIVLPTNSVTLSGSGSDNDGAISGYSWTKISGPGNGTLTNANTPTLSLSNLTAGTYTFRLTVTDNGNLTGFDDAIVIVNSQNNGVNYSYYEGYYSSMPNFNLVSPIKTGVVDNYSLEPRMGEYQYAFKYNAYIDIPSAGQYTFYTTSDDGSKLYIDGAEIVNNDFLQGPTERSGSVFLTAGKKAIEVSFFQLHGGAVLEVRYEGPGIAKQLIPNSSLYRNLASARFGSEDTALQIMSVTASPNPAKDFVNLQFDNRFEEINYSIADVLGKIYKEGKASNTSRITVSLQDQHMPPGIYFIKLETETGALNMLKITKE